MTSLIQPTDQGVLESMKRRYKRSLLQDVLLSEDLIYPTTFTKSITMKVVVEKISLAWDQITLWLMQYHQTVTVTPLLWYWLTQHRQTVTVSPLQQNLLMCFSQWDMH